MSDFVLLWIAKSAVDSAVVLLFVAIVVLCGLPLVIRQAIREARCKHDGRVSETSACDAICSQCGKNLGFIGAWRKREEK